MILRENEINERRIKPVVGDPISLDIKNPKTIGSPVLFLKSFVNKRNDQDTLKLDSKCNFERRQNGMILRTNYSNKRTIVLFAKEDILEIRLFAVKNI